MKGRRYIVEGCMPWKSKPTVGGGCLDPGKTPRERFNLIRVCDPERYPAVVEIAWSRYHVPLTGV